jgi:predicted RNA-binding protein YlqC (UPF0109 family)
VSMFEEPKFASPEPDEDADFDDESSRSVADESESAGAADEDGLDDDGVDEEALDDEDDDEDDDDEADEADDEVDELDELDEADDESDGAEDDGNAVAENRLRGGAAKAVLEHVTKMLVDDPESVIVEVSEGRSGLRFSVHVAQGDMGRIIGRRGRTAQAIRTLVRAAAAGEGVEASVDIVD